MMKKTDTPNRFCIAGKIRCEQSDHTHAEMSLAVYVFDNGGAMLASCELDKEGLYSIIVPLPYTSDITLIAGPAGMPQQIHLSSAYQKTFSAQDWTGEEAGYFLRFDAVLPRDIWQTWLPLRICLSGHIRKVNQRDGFININPIPYIKVEVFDVDRAGCLWPAISKWWEVLLDRPVIHLQDLLREPPFLAVPLPGAPAPDPEIKLEARAGARDQHAPPPLEHPPLPHQTPPGIFISPAAPESIPEAASYVHLQNTFNRVGEARLIENSIATRLDRLTVTSKTPPWRVFPDCYFSQTKASETTTDCNGYFNCCFNWWPFLFRQGRLSFDAVPDIIIKMTQVINGIESVVYLDPYTGIRWSLNHAHMDLFLDDEEIICGKGHSHEPPEDGSVRFTRIGDDEVYKIDQSSGLYNDPPASNIAYGSDLLISGQFGTQLNKQAKYYRISYSKQGSTEFIPINTALADTRVKKSTLQGQTYALGPTCINDVSSLYELRNFSEYYWYNPDWLITWRSWINETNTNKYTLRLELFDANGTRLTRSDGIDYRDGTVAPPAILPSTSDSCKLKITVDNKPPEVDLVIPTSINPYGVLPLAPCMSLDFQIHANQKNGRLRSWGLYYTKGTNPTAYELANGFSNSGQPENIVQTVPGGNMTNNRGSGMLANLHNTTCAFALKLWATAHIRDGRHFIYYQEQIKVFAVEKTTL